MKTTPEIPQPLPLTEQLGESFPRLVQVMRSLLAEDGCPWDRAQDFGSLRRYVLEEACEVIDAIDSGVRAALAEELGDLLLQVVFLSELARSEGAFGPDDAIRLICEKLVRRHPHVFGDASAADPQSVERTWKRIKSREKPPQGLLSTLPRAYPALLRAYSLSQQAAQVGFDWPDRRGSRAKVDEELDELDRAVDCGDPAQVDHELGDLLFATVNLARHLGLNPEESLRRASDRFADRFGHVEARVRAERGDWPRDAEGNPTALVPLVELDRYWNEAKERP